MNAHPNASLPTWVILQDERPNPPPPPPPPFPVGAEVHVVQNGDLIGNDRWQQLEPQGPLMIQAALGSQWTPNPPPLPFQHICWRRREAFRADDSSASPAEGPRGYSNVVLKVLQRWDGEWAEGEGALKEGELHSEMKANWKLDMRGLRRCDRTSPSVNSRRAHGLGQLCFSALLRTLLHWSFTEKKCVKLCCLQGFCLFYAQINLNSFKAEL